MDFIFLLAQDAAMAQEVAKHTVGFWEVINQNMTAILGVILTVLAGVGAAFVGCGKLIWAISNSWIERANRRADEEAASDAKERAKRVAVLDMTIESLPKHLVALTDTCEILESLKDDHAIIHSAAIPALSAVICVAEKPQHDIPSDVIRDMKEAHDILKGREAARAKRRKDEMSHKARESSDHQHHSETSK